MQEETKPMSLDEILAEQAANHRKDGWMLLKDGDLVEKGDEVWVHTPERGFSWVPLREYAAFSMVGSEYDENSMPKIRRKETKETKPMSLDEILAENALKLKEDTVTVHLWERGIGDGNYNIKRVWDLAKGEAKEATPPDPKTKYLRRAYPVDGQVHTDTNGNQYILVDVYTVLQAFAVSSHALGHAIKKLLCAGIRGKGGKVQDLEESKVAIDRGIQEAKLEGAK